MVAGWNGGFRSVEPKQLTAVGGNTDETQSRSRTSTILKKPSHAFTNGMDENVLERWPATRTAAIAVRTLRTQPALGFYSACSVSGFPWARCQCERVSLVIPIPTPTRSYIFFYCRLACAGTAPQLHPERDKLSWTASTVAIVLPRINRTTQAPVPKIKCQYIP